MGQGTEQRVREIKSLEGALMGFSCVFYVKSHRLMFPPPPSLNDINKSCLEQFRAHWECLEQNNQQLWHCRPAETALNACVFEKLVRFPYARFFCLSSSLLPSFTSSLKSIHLQSLAFEDRWVRTYERNKA